MSAYIQPIMNAFLLFPVAAAILTLPYMLYNYRKYSSVSPLRSLVLFSFLLYLMCAYFLVILPLPSRESVAQLTTPTKQLIPFHFVVSFLRDTVLDIRDISTYLPALKQGVFIEPAFNILLTVPFGAYMSYYFRENIKKTVFFTFLLTLSFELLQLSALFGLYPRPYRLFDVDDLMLNTLGGLIGYYLGRGISHALPSKRAMDEKSLRRGRKVSYTRRLFASGVDFFALSLLQALLSFLFGNGVWIFPVSYLLYFVVLTSLTKGRTLGKLLVRIRVETVTRGRFFPLQMLIRYGLPYLSFLLVTEFTALIIEFGTVWATLAALAIYGLVFLLYFVSWIRSFHRGKRMWYELASDTQNISTMRITPTSDDMKKES